jgi:hypothetical protein
MSAEDFRAMQADPSAQPFAAMARMLQLLRQRARDRTVDGAKLEDLLAVAASLETVHAWAAEMQLGAEGFDNMTSARAYGDVQEHLINAAQDIEKACQILYRRDSAY